ncbi:BspA family leucine-rich repeat surface protein [archaeon]|nr:MAG: BspA family leucine-rich repeat surface protein [archaeon]
MFSMATQFNQPIERWDIGRVVVMSNMFSGAACFNQATEQWDVSGVVYVDSGMFLGAFSFNQPLISRWNLKSKAVDDEEGDACLSDSRGRCRP